jgi:hypothetical protein
MSKRGRQASGRSIKDLWISPEFSFEGKSGTVWEHRSGEIRGSIRLLELADIALGLKKPVARKKPVAAESSETQKAGS